MTWMGTLQRSATQAAKTSPAIAEPPIPIRKTRCASAIGARALPSAQMAAAEIWSGSDAMMSRIPPGSTRATARASSIPDGMGRAEIRTPYSELETKKLVLTIILIYPAGLQTGRGYPRGHRGAAGWRVHPRLRRRWPGSGNGPHDRERIRIPRFDPNPPQRGRGTHLHNPLRRSPGADRPAVHGRRPSAGDPHVSRPRCPLDGGHEI